MSDDFLTLFARALYLDRLVDVLAKSRTTRAVFITVVLAVIGAAIAVDLLLGTWTH